MKIKLNEEEKILLLVILLFDSVDEINAIIKPINVPIKANLIVVIKNFIDRKNNDSLGYSFISFLKEKIAFILSKKISIPKEFNEEFINTGEIKNNKKKINKNTNDFLGITHFFVKLLFLFI